MKILSYFAIVLASTCCLACANEDFGEPPDVKLVAIPLVGAAPLSVEFSFSLVGETELTVDRYEWDFDGDGVVDKTNGADDRSAVHVYELAGEYSPNVRVVFNEADSWSRGILGDKVRVN